jgi:Sec7-like guanine-nucleotide exchange factor
MEGEGKTKKLERALKQEESPYRVPQSEGEALLNSFGIKISNKSIETLARSRKIEFDRQIRKQKAKIKQAVKKFDEGSIDEDEYIKQVGKIMENINKIQMTFFGRLAGVDPYGFRWFDKLSDGEEK